MFIQNTYIVQFFFKVKLFDYKDLSMLGQLLYTRQIMFFTKALRKAEHCPF